MLALLTDFDERLRSQCYRTGRASASTAHPSQRNGQPSVEEVAKRIGKIAGYQERFHKVFGKKRVTALELAQAIACFERTIVSGNSAFDRFEVGGDENALSPAQIRGLRLFRGKANCLSCHTGFNFTDELYHNLGIGNDPGRYLVTHKEADRGRFKTPSLREITRTAPYMHDGSLKTLEEVIESYNRGGNKNPHLDTEMRPLNLTAGERADLIEFLKALEGEGWQQSAPVYFP